MEKRLGKGLSALLGDTSISALNQSKENEPILRDIQLKLIKPNPNQPRSFFDEEKINELAESLKTVGLIEPIIVTQEGSFYQIVAGERRYRAAQKAQFETIPAIVKNETKEHILEIMLIENIQREDLNPIEEALCYEQILQNKNITQDELSTLIGKSRSHISNHLRLLSLPEDVRNQILSGKISLGHAKVLVSLDFEEQKHYLERILTNRLTVRQLETEIKNNLEKNSSIPSVKIKTMTPKEKRAIEDPFLAEAENIFRDFFQTKVKIHKMKNEEGKIEIFFYNNEDVEKIIEKIQED